MYYSLKFSKLCCRNVVRLLIVIPEAGKNVDVPAVIRMPSGIRVDRCVPNTVVNHQYRFARRLAIQVVTVHPVMLELVTTLMHLVFFVHNAL